MELNRINGETEFEWKLRLCLAKKRKELDADWVEIRDALGLDITPDQLRKQAVGYEEYDSYIHGNVEKVHTTILSLSDFHVPFELDFEKYLSEYKNRIDILQLNGDIVDLKTLSKFPKDYRTNPIEDVIKARDYLLKLITYINPKKVVVNYGNHDLRLGQYLDNADSDVKDFLPQTPLDYIFTDGFHHYDRKTGTNTRYEALIKVLDNVEIEYAGTWYSQIGKTIFCHPKAFSSGPLKTAEKALYWFRNEGFNFNSLVMAHTHRVGSYAIGNTMIYEQGAFCHIEKMMYSDGLLINSQKKGFAVVCQDKDGNTLFDKTKFILIE